MAKRQLVLITHNLSNISDYTCQPQTAANPMAPMGGNPGSEAQFLVTAICLKPLTLAAAPSPVVKPKIFV
jgi:hypothetical protein